MPEDEKKILAYQRQSKHEAGAAVGRRDSMLIQTSQAYERLLKSAIGTLFNRVAIVGISVVLLSLSFWLDV